jgi:penicillin V acylase-like amidase (Ntn superfamily)
MATRRRSPILAKSLDLGTSAAHFGYALGMTARWPSVGLLAAAWLGSSPAFPCTTFLAQHAGQPVVGKDYDWTESAGLLVTNPRGLRKTALTLNAQDTPATWVSKYASLTFNQYGVEFPNGGMNEKGLMAEIMWLDSSQYPAADSRPVLSELQWIQYALDGYASVAEFVVAAAGIRVVKAYAAVHYLLCDATSECAAFEYIGGKLLVTRSANMPAKTLTNDTYADSAAYLAGFQGFGGNAVPPTSSSSLDRFVRASALARTTEGTTIPTSAFQILESAAQSSTQWSIVYVPTSGTAHFRTKTMPKIKSASLVSFLLDCPAQRQVLDIDTDATGDVAARFVDYTTAQNRQLVAQTMASIASSLPAGTMDLLVAAPDTYSCVGSGNASTGIGGRTGNLGAAGATSNAETSASGCSCALPTDTRASGRTSLLVAIGLLGLNRRRTRGRRSFS